MRAVYSRGLTSASQLAGDFLPKTVEVFAGDDLDKLLARQDIEAVIIVLPIDIMVKLQIIGETCVNSLFIAVGHYAMPASGQARPERETSVTDRGCGSRIVATDVQMRGLVWGVSENWRFEPAFLEVSQLHPSFVSESRSHLCLHRAG